MENSCSRLTPSTTSGIPCLLKMENNGTLCKNTSSNKKFLSLNSLVTSLIFTIWTIQIIRVNQFLLRSNIFLTKDTRRIDHFGWLMTRRMHLSQKQSILMKPFPPTTSLPCWLILKDQSHSGYFRDSTKFTFHCFSKLATNTTICSI